MIIPGLRQLVTPLNYLRIRRKSVKMWYDWWYPLALTVITMASILLTGWKVNVFGEAGVIHQLTELLKMLIGFYIAALAAVATFPSAVLDQELSGSPTTLVVLRKGEKIPISLSRRRFLSYLFGYLAFMSLLLFVAGTVVRLAAGDLKGAVPLEYSQCFKWAGLSFYLFWIYNLLIATLLGLHYLSDRIHRSRDGNVSGTIEEK